MNQPNKTSFAFYYKLYTQSAKTLWIVLNLNFLIGVGMVYAGFQLDQATAPIQTEVSTGRAISGRDEPKDTIIDAHYERTNDQIGELLSGGAFMVIASLTGAGILVWIRSQARKYRPENESPVGQKAA
ncbi:MAG: hypothetical protein JNM39_09710 [Bdellovibrionaceae bacterium]|nr:hypothetical protein [Pseudobdellovibrionaceae bacterium]